jgi:hypothetical protein
METYAPMAGIVFGWLVFGGLLGLLAGTLGKAVRFDTEGRMGLKRVGLAVRFSALILATVGPYLCASWLTRTAASSTGQFSWHLTSMAAGAIGFQTASRWRGPGALVPVLPMLVVASPIAAIAGLAVAGAALSVAKPSDRAAEIGFACLSAFVAAASGSWTTGLLVVGTAVAAYALRRKS